MQKEANLKNKTFWNELRVKNGYEFTDLAQTLGRDYSTVAKWFSGGGVPKKKYAKDVCDLFGVDLELGYNEFIKAHEQWKSNRGISKKNSKTKKIKVASVNVNTTSVVPKTLTAEIKTLESEIMNKILKAVYSKLDFEPYEKLRATLISGGDPREAIYGVVSYDEYLEFDQILNGI